MLHLRWHKVDNHGTCKVVSKKREQKIQIYGMVESYFILKKQQRFQQSRFIFWA